MPFEEVEGDRGEERRDGEVVVGQLPTYPSAYDRFLIVVGLGLNVLTFWTAWNWATP